MIQGIAQQFAFSAPRRIVALLLAISLSIALVPCAMAIEVVEEGHDCCPPELQLDAVACCQIDDVSVDARGGLLKVDGTDNVDQGVSPSFPEVIDKKRDVYWATAGPPDLPRRSLPLHKLNCVYLK